MSLAELRKWVFLIVMLPTSDCTTISQIMEIVKSSNRPSTILQKISLVLKNAETVNQVLYVQEGCKEKAVSGNFSIPSFEITVPGALAGCVTVQEVLVVAKWS